MQSDLHAVRHYGRCRSKEYNDQHDTPSMQGLEGAWMTAAGRQEGTQLEAMGTSLLGCGPFRKHWPFP